MKKAISNILTASLLLSITSLTACSKQEAVNENVLRIASWDEYIDMGGEESYYSADSLPIYEEFEAWYQEQTGKKIKVEYVALQDNETMYNKIKMGDHYDLLCPSEYMAMKLKSENLLLPYPTDFFDASVEENYYAQNVSAYTEQVFGEAGLTGYIAGYMWGTTGFVFNPQKISNDDIMQSWLCTLSEVCERKITAKDNVRDTYFMGLGMYYEKELLSLQEDLLAGKITKDTYKAELSKKMNDTSPQTVNAVRELLKDMRKNLYGVETDEGKLEMIMGRLGASYQWSGDAVFILDEAEDDYEGTKDSIYLEYSIPEAASNIWFDGWVMMKNANVDAATAFVNYISRPDNAIRNMYYIGYTSCLAGQEIYDYVSDCYAADEGEQETTLYDLSYFFGDNFEPLIVPTEQTRRQLFAQYPDENTIDRLVVMNYFDRTTNERLNRMWNNIK